MTPLEVFLYHSWMNDKECGFSLRGWESFKPRAGLQTKHSGANSILHPVPFSTWSIFSRSMAKKKNALNETHLLSAIHTWKTNLDTFFLFVFSLSCLYTYILLVGCRCCSCGWFRFVSSSSSHRLFHCCFAFEARLLEETKIQFSFLPSEHEWNSTSWPRIGWLFGWEERCRESALPFDWHFIVSDDIWKVQTK